MIDFMTNSIWIIMIWIDFSWVNQMSIKSEKKNKGEIQREIIILKDVQNEK